MDRNHAYRAHVVIVRRILALIPIAATTVFLSATCIFADTGTVIIPAAKDNTLFSDPTGSLSSGSGAYLFAGNNSGSSARRGVIAFDIAAHVSAGSVIDSVALILNVSNAPNEIPQEIEVHRVLAAWGEGASVAIGGSGAPSTPGDATWIHTFYPDQVWSSPGGSFSAASSAAQTVGTFGPHTWSSSDMVADVQLWLDSPAVNFGWLLRGDEATASSVRRFDSRGIETVENRPYLFIAYTSGPSAASATTWGAVKALFWTSAQGAVGKLP